MKIYHLINLSTGGKTTVLVSSIMAILAPIATVILAVAVFIVVDFILGFVVSVKVKKKGFMSGKFWGTIWKLAGALTVIILGDVLDTHVLSFMPRLHLAHIFAGIVCGADLWSILANFAILSDHPIFNLIKKWGRSEIVNKIGVDLADELDKQLNNNNNENE